MIAPRSLVRLMLLVLLAAVATSAHAQPDPGVRFGVPIASGGLLAVLAENPSDQLLTFTVMLTYETDAGETRTVAVKLRKSARKALRRGRTLKATVTLSGTDSSGASIAARKVVRLKA